MRIVRPICWFALAAAVLFAPQAQSQANPRIEGAAIVRGAGRAKASGSKTWRDTTTGDVLTAGITVQASDEQPLEMTLPDGVTIALDPGALIQWGTAIKLPSETNHWTRGYHLLLEDGELEVRMPPGPKGQHAFLVSTSAGTLTDWRGQLHIRVVGDTTAAAIYEGALVVGSNGQGFAVYDGAGIVIRKGINPDKSRGIPPTPAWDTTGNTLALVEGHGGASVDFTWKPVARAASYRVEIATDPTMVRTVTRASTSDTRFSATESSGGARYWARVRAVGAEGIVGEWSPARPLRTVHYEIPDGAIVAADGAVVLPDGCSVSLPDADGLEVAYESPTGLPMHQAIPLYWAPVTGPLRLKEDTLVRVAHLRDPTLNSEVRLVLARRQLAARIDLEPRIVHWPPDSIDARVVLYDPSGRIDTTQAQVMIEAQLNLSPLGIQWQRAANTWTGRIAPHAIGGPSILRLRVVDDQGTEIGAAFVDIDH